MGTQAAWVLGLKEDGCPFEGPLSCLGDHFTVHRAFLPQSLLDILQVSWAPEFQKQKQAQRSGESYPRLPSAPRLPVTSMGSAAWV